MVISVSIPQIFFRFITISLGHLIPAAVPVISSTASATLSAMTSVIMEALSGAKSGLRSRVKASAVPDSVCQLRPLRPLPAVWISAVTTVP